MLLAQTISFQNQIAARIYNPAFIDVIKQVNLCVLHVHIFAHMANHTLVAPVTSLPPLGHMLASSSCCQ